MLTTEERDNLVKYKLERARETWNEIVGIVDGGYWYAAANRMYYACYYMVSALLLKNGLNAHTHGGAIGLFGLHFIKTGLIDSDLGKFYSQLFELRQTGDYDDWKVVTEADITPLVPTAIVFLDAVENQIRNDGYLD